MKTALRTLFSNGLFKI